MRKLLDVRPAPGSSTLVGALTRALPRCSPARLASTLGYAFAFSLDPDGGDLYQTGAIEWGHYGAGLPDLPCKLEVFDCMAKGSNPASKERNAEVRAQAWDRVRASLDAGVPAVAWGAMTAEQRDAGKGAFEWSLLVGYDDEARTYTVAHRNVPAPYELAFDAFGYSDPVQWFSVLVAGDEKPPAVLPVLARAIEYGRGKRIGADGAARVGIAALELWLEAFRSGRVKKNSLPGHARFLCDARTSAAEYLREVKDELGAGKRAGLLEAAGHYERVAQAASKLADSKGDEAVTALTGALDSERRAVERLEALVGR